MGIRGSLDCLRSILLSWAKQKSFLSGTNCEAVAARRHVPPRASHYQWRALWFRKTRLCLAARIAEQSVLKRCSAIWPRERLPRRHADPDAYLGVPGVTGALWPAAQQHRVAKHSSEAPAKAHWLMVLDFGSSARLSSSFPVPTVVAGARAQHGT